MSKELLQKVVDTALVGAGGGGLLNADQADRFIDYMWDETVLNQEGRQIRMNADTRDLDRLSVGTRIARGATEGVDTGVNEKPTFTKVSVTTKKFRLDYELTTESLEDNIAGDDLEDHVARLMATQFGNDLEDVAINGDTGSADDLLKQFDGFRKLYKSGTGHPDGAATTIDFATESDASSGVSKNTFNHLLKGLDRKWLQRKQNLRFYTSPGLVQDFLHSLTDRETQLGDVVIFNGPPSGVSGSAGATNIRPYGITLIEVPLFSEGYALSADDPDAAGGYGYAELGFPENRIWGTKREIKVYREFSAKKDAVEFTVYVRFGVQVETTDNCVLGYNIPVA